VIKVLIADDHPLVRDGVAAILDGAEDISVVGACADGSEVAEMAARTEPDVLLTDLRMPTMSGLEAARAVLSTRPDVRVILLSGSVTAADIREAKALGVTGFLVKTADLSDALPDFVRAVAAGHTVWHASDAAVARNPR
jgi:DNA-binding NarL/FixJ family response regulator